jgi:uncharacterized protein
VLNLPFMKKTLWLAFLALASLTGFTQSSSKKATKADAENTLLWRISGNGLIKPSYLFGTMHMVCANDIIISDSLSTAIKNADMMGMMMKIMMNPGQLNMRGDTSLADLLKPEEYEAVKKYFSNGSAAMLPFSMLEKMKPFFLQALMMDGGGKCDNMIIMEQLVMTEAKKHSKKIDGLETLDFQLAIFDKIPYKLQAQTLVKLATDTSKTDRDEIAVLSETYKKQELSKMLDMTKSDASINQYADLLLYNRNSNWAKQLKELMQQQSLVIAVGAGHLPGDKGVIELLRKAGYKVEPVKNDMLKKPKQVQG